MVAAVPDMAHFSFPISKFEKTDDGDIIVYGKCTDGSIDSDHQIVDPDWSGQALESWLKTGGNVRVQHSPFLYPAGKGLALDINRDGDGGHWLKALVVEDTAKKLVEKGVLRDFSIGVLDPALVRHHTALMGKINGGRIGEVSLVDRGSNKNTTFQIAKADGDGNPRLVAKMVGATPLAMASKRKFSAGERRSLASQGHALPDGSYPIKGPADLGPAAHLQQSGHGDTDAAGQLIARRAKDFGVDNPLDTGKANKGAFPGAAPPFKKKGDDGPPGKGDSDEPSGGSDDQKTCISCKAKNDSDAKRCSNCGKKLGKSPDNLFKGDGAQDFPGDKGDDETSSADYAADDDKDSGKDDDAGDDDKASKAAGMTREQYLRKVRKAGRKKDPSAAAGGAKGKQSDPAPLPGEDGAEGSSIGGLIKTAGTEPSLTMRRLHDAVCPATKFKVVKRYYGLDNVGDAVPLRELQSFAIVAVGQGKTTEADYFLDMVKTAESIKAIGPGTLLQARKAFPELFPNVHPAQTGDVHPGQFTRGYVGAGHPDLSAAPHGSSLPGAPVHHVSATDFTRGYIAGGRADVSPGEGRQATFDSAVMGQAQTAMTRMHEQVSNIWPDLCSLSITRRDYASGDGSTGIAGSSLPTLPTAPGESGPTMDNYSTATKAEPVLRRKLAKARRKIVEQRDEIAFLGSMPDPDLAPYRGVPQLGGPVDRTSYIDKAAAIADGVPGSPEDPDFIDYLNALATSGNPATRANAREVLKGVLTAPGKAG